MKNNKISKSEIVIIKTFLANQRVFYKDIQQELIDHLACQIEGNWKEEESFKEVFLRETKNFNAFGIQQRITLQKSIDGLKIFLHSMFVKGPLSSISLSYLALAILSFYLFPLEEVFLQKAIQFVFTTYNLGAVILLLWIFFRNKQLLYYTSFLKWISSFFFLGSIWTFIGLQLLKSSHLVPYHIFIFCFSIYIFHQIGLTLFKHKEEYIYKNE